MAIPNPIAAIFGVERLLKPADRIGALPTTGGTYRQLFRMAAPSVAEMVLTSLIGSIDTMMVGSMGSAAIAAVGLVGQPRLILLAVIFGVNAGLTAVVARRKGEGRQADAGATLRTALILVTLLSLALTAAGLLLREQFMHLAGANEDTQALSVTYFSILMAGFPINVLTLTINAAQRGIGNTRITMVTNLAANLVNVLFNYMLIGGHWGCPALGVAGAAIATNIGNLVGFLLALYAALGKKSYFSLKFGKEDFRFRGEVLRPILQVSYGAMLEQLAIRAGFLMFSRMVADLGTGAYASHQICLQFLSLSFCAADGIGVAGTALVGFHLGRKRPDISKLFGKVSQRVAFCAALVIAGTFALFKYPLIGLFTDDADVLTLSGQVMYIVALFQPFQMSAIVMMGCLRGAGDTKYTARITLLCITLIRPATCALAIYVLNWGLVGAWLASLTEMLARMALSYLRFSGGKWMKLQV